MSLSVNSDYRKVFSTAAIIGASLLPMGSSAAEVVNEPIVQKAAYDKFVDYSTSRQSTSEDSFIKNDTEMLKWLDISEFSKLISMKFNAKIIDYWEPAEGELEKTCLFVKLDKQDELMAELDLELELYLLLEDKLKENHFFNMIALL